LAEEGLRVEKNGVETTSKAMIEVAVLSTRKGSVKLGFTAPPSVSICRQEIDQMELAASPLATVAEVTELPDPLRRLKEWTFE
jgi:carbon storage regulator CsrA